MHRRTVLLGAAAYAAGPSGVGAAVAADSRLVVPPEEHRHDRTFMQWPVSRQVYSNLQWLDYVQQTITEIANTIVEFEPVVMLAARENHTEARRYLSGAVDLWDVPTEDLWCRDSGPLFGLLPDGGLAVSHIRFNGWGGKQVHKRDGRVAERVADRLGLPLIDSGLTGEPGGVEQDGHGRLMAHESSWVNENRNPGMSLQQVEQRLLAAYGADRMIWSPGLMGEDITDYHIDSLARFTGSGQVLINLPEVPYPGDPWHIAALETHDRLIEAGLAVRVIPEPRIRRVKSYDFVASYVNYYVCNGAVLAAQFGDQDTDEIARVALTELYPDREVVMLNVDDLGEIGGGVHCATQQMPAV